VSVVPLNVSGVDTVVITLTDSAAIDHIRFTPESDPSATSRFADRGLQPGIVSNGLFVE